MEVFDPTTPLPTILGSIVVGLIGVILEVVRRRGNDVSDSATDAKVQVSMTGAEQAASDYLLHELKDQLERSAEDVQAMRKQATTAFQEMASARDEARRAQSEMEEMRTRWKVERNASDDYIRELVDHIVNELPPPPPEAPSVLAHLFRGDGHGG